MIHLGRFGYLYISFLLWIKIIFNTTGQTLRSQRKKSRKIFFFSAEIRSPSSEYWKNRYYILFQLLARKTIGLLKGINNHVKRIGCSRSLFFSGDIIHLSFLGYAYFFFFLLKGNIATVNYLKNRSAGFNMGISVPLLRPVYDF